MHPTLLADLQLIKNKNTPEGVITIGISIIISSIYYH